jgi:hypothetical protein
LKMSSSGVATLLAVPLLACVASLVPAAFLGAVAQAHAAWGLCYPHGREKKITLPLTRSSLRPFSLCSFRLAH